MPRMLVSARLPGALLARLPERVSVYRPDPVSGTLPSAPVATQVPCLISTVQQRPLSGTAGDAPADAVHWTLGFLPTQDVRARDQIVNGTATYDLVTPRGPHSFEGLRVFEAERLA